MAYSVDNFTMLFYDKSYNGTHEYTNKDTIDIKISDLFAGDYLMLTNDLAIEEFNKFDNPYRLIKPDLSMYQIYMFINPNGEKYGKYTVVGVNNDILKNCVINKLKIPDEEFLNILCKYHYLYTRPIKHSIIHNKTYDANIHSTEIIKVVQEKTGDILDMMIENPNFLNCQLYSYQKRSIYWMLNIENEYKTLTYNISDEICIGDVIYDTITQNMSQGENRYKITFSGGALIDEVGLGKTLQMLTLSLLNRPSQKIDYIKKENPWFQSRATLVLCPNHLTGQWVREIEKMTKMKEYNIKILLLVTKVHHDKYTYKDILDADFVVVSFNFLAGDAYINGWLDKVSEIKNYHKISEKQFNQTTFKESMKKMGFEKTKDINTLNEKRPLLNLIEFNRLIVDEIHEIYTVNKYQHMINLLPTFNGKYKWCISGTPFDKNNECLLRMFDFVTNYQNTLKDKVFGIQTISDHMKNNFFRKNTKKSVNLEFQLQPLKETVVWLKFTQTERMMYNAFLANPNNDKFSKYLRQLCCHPKLAEETKDLLSHCKTLDDIEKIMVSHYKKEMDDSENIIKYLRNRILISEKRIKKIERKRQRKFLRKKGFTVAIDKNSLNLNNDELYNVKINLPPELNIVDDNENNIDNNDDDSDDEDDIPTANKPHIIISDDNQDHILKLVGKDLDKNPSMAIKNIENYINQINDKIVQAQKTYDGKKTTYDFYKNVIDKIKKTADSNQNDQNKNNNDDDDEICGICLDEIPDNDIGVTKCGHIFCYGCIKNLTIKKNECPYCRKALQSNEIFMISYERKKDLNSTNVEIKDKTSLINEVGTKLANLIYYIKGSKDQMIIFSQWDDLLRKIGLVLDDYGVKNVFCRGNVWQRDKAIRTFNSDPSTRVIMLSSESAASGTNLTKATKVIIVDPVHGTYEYRKNTENQAIGRAHRMGQTKQVEVIRFVIRDTIEEEIYNMNIIEDKKYVENIKIFEFTDDAITLSKDQVNQLSETHTSIQKKKIVKTTKSKNTKTEQTINNNNNSVLTNNN